MMQQYCVHSFFFLMYILDNLFYLSMISFHDIRHACCLVIIDLAMMLISLIRIIFHLKALST
uniref:Uncharacterized protein n=1 Tax=Arundo donax TaxID=35708 RepID=A0A0A9EJA2_ARUDO